MERLLTAFKEDM